MANRVSRLSPRWAEEWEVVVSAEPKPAVGGGLRLRGSVALPIAVLFGRRRTPASDFRVKRAGVRKRRTWRGSRKKLPPGGNPGGSVEASRGGVAARQGTIRLIRRPLRRCSLGPCHPVPRSVLRRPSPACPGWPAGRHWASRRTWAWGLPPQPLCGVHRLPISLRP